MCSGAGCGCDTTGEGRDRLPIYPQDDALQVAIPSWDTCASLFPCSGDWWRLLYSNENSVSPPSCQHFESGDGRFSHRIQSSASFNTCPLMHLAYIICSFNVGSSGLMPGAAIFGTKNLHHGTI